MIVLVLFKIVYVGLAVDIIHEGHINILKTNEHIQHNIKHGADMGNHKDRMII